MKSTTGSKGNEVGQIVSKRIVLESNPVIVYFYDTLKFTLSASYKIKLIFL